MRSVRVTALAVVSSLALFTGAAQATESCWYPNEAKAAQLRDFQIMMMVGALQCRTTNSLAISQYNEFITRQRGLLDANANVLKAHFLRENGFQEGKRAYDRYATSLANGQSQRATDPGFCARVEGLVRIATAASQPDLLILAQSTSKAPESGYCAPTNYASAETVARPQPAAVAIAAPAPEATTDAAAPAAEATIDQSAGQPVIVSADAAPPAPAKAVSAPVAAPASREDALQAAIVALQSAAAALQAASASAETAEAKSAPKPGEPTLVKVADAPVVPPKETED